MSKKTRTLTNKAGKLMKCDGQMLKKVIEAKGYKCHELSKMLRYCSDYLTTCCRMNKISDVAAKYLMDYKIFPQMYDLEGEIKVDQPKEVKIDKDEQKYIESDKKAVDELQKRMDRINENSTYGIPKPDKEVEFGTPYGVVRSEKDLRNCIKQAISSKYPIFGIRLMNVSKILKQARANGLSYDVEDMRNDLLAYAAKLDDYSEEWIEIVRHLSLRYGACSNSSSQEVKKVLNEKYSKLEKGVKGVDYGYDPAPKNTSYCSYYAAGHDIAKGIFKLMQVTIDDLKRDPEFKELIKQAVKEAYEEL